MTIEYKFIRNLSNNVVCYENLQSTIDCVPDYKKIDVIDWLPKN
jgi:hypothetical protein